MNNTYKDKQLTNWHSPIKMLKNEWLRLGKYSLFKESRTFRTVKDTVVLHETNSVTRGVMMLLRLAKGDDNGK